MAHGITPCTTRAGDNSGSTPLLLSASSTTHHAIDANKDAACVRWTADPPPPRRQMSAQSLAGCAVVHGNSGRSSGQTLLGQDKDQSQDPTGPPPMLRAGVGGGHAVGVFLVLRKMVRFSLRGA